MKYSFIITALKSNPDYRIAVSSVIGLVEADVEKVIARMEHRNKFGGFDEVVIDIDHKLQTIFIWSAE